MELEAEVSEVRLEPPPQEVAGGEGLGVEGSGVEGTSGEEEGRGERTAGAGGAGGAAGAGGAGGEAGESDGSAPEGRAMTPGGIRETRSLVFSKFSRSTTLAVSDEWSGGIGEGNLSKPAPWRPNTDGLVPLRAADGVLRCGVSFSEGDRWLLAWGRRVVTVWRRATAEGDKGGDEGQFGEDLDSIFSNGDDNSVGSVGSAGMTEGDDGDEHRVGLAGLRVGGGGGTRRGLPGVRPNP